MPLILVIKIDNVWSAYFLTHLIRIVFAENSEYALFQVIKIWIEKQLFGIMKVELNLDFKKVVFSELSSS